ncbi:MAG: DUF2508 family protein [Lachnospiraceae bacterium]|nr:DUF2508 family protein [Lachnospiraceae bacterium]
MTKTKKSTEPLTYKEQLLMDIRQAVCTLDTVFIQLNSNTDPDLIDCYIYELKAAQKRYKYLLEQARKNGITNHDKFY